ncbi:MAG: hypothetical protein ACQERP_09710 [Pseudomonadota bacterium]
MKKVEMAHRGDVIEAGIYYRDIVRKKGHSAQSNSLREEACGLITQIVGHSQDKSTSE